MKQKKQKAKRSLFHKIVNVFISIVVTVIVLIVLFLGVSQTSTFRSYLKEKVVETTNSSITGKLHIGELEGTLLTTLTLRDIALTDSAQNTIFYSDEINIKVNPFALLARKIHLRQILVKEAQLSLQQNKERVWNIATLSYPSTEETNLDSVNVEETTSVTSEESSFPFVVQISDLQLIDFRFIMQTYENVGNNSVYRYIDFQDLIIDRFNLSAKAIIDLSKNNYSLNLKKLSFAPNVEEFFLDRFSGIFVYQNQNAIVKDFKLTSDNSNIQINARLNNADFTNDFSLEKLQNTETEIELVMNPFEFNDLSSFVPVTNLLDHKVEMYLKADGPYGNLNLRQLNIELNNTKLNVNGRVANLHKPSDLFLDVSITESFANYTDVKSLLPDIGLPDFKEITLSNFGADFIGRPSDFSVDLKTNINKGRLEGKVKLNLDADPIIYDLDLKTTNINLAPIVDQPSKINSSIVVKGKGIDPEQLNSNFKIDLRNSSYGDYQVTNLAFSGKAKQKKIELTLRGKAFEANFNSDGILNFTEEIPSYKIKGNIDQLNLSKLMGDDYDSNLNFYYEANGSSFQLDSLIGKFDVKLDSSRFRDSNIDDAQLSLQLVKNDDSRNIYLTSDFVDFSITGQFSLADAIDVLGYEASTIAEITSNKVEQFNPLYKPDSTSTEREVPEEIISKELNFNYSFTFKDFDLIATILNEEKLDISGSGSGKVSNTKDNFTIETDLIIDYFLMSGDEVFYISELETDFRLTRDNSSIKFDDLFGSISLNISRLYSGSDIENIEADVIFNQSRMFFNLSSVIDKQLGIQTDGTFTLSPREQEIELDQLAIVYNDVEWENLRPISMTLKPGQSIDISDFSLYSDPAALFVYGILHNDGRQDIRFDVKDLNGELLSQLLFNSKSRLFNADLNVDGKVNGTFTEPLVDLNISLDSVSYEKVQFGSLTGNINYKEKNITIDAAFVDSVISDVPKFTLKGNIPIDLNYQLEGERIKETDELSLKIRSKEFNLAALGNILPAIRNQNGLLTTELDISGTINDPKLNGNIKLVDGEYNLLANNLNYKTDFTIAFEDQEFTLEKAVIKNSGGTPYNGTLNISGSGKLETFVPTSATLRMNGNLAVLGDRSKAVQPLIYGDLFVESDGDWVLNYREAASYFSGNVNIRNADLTFVAEAANYQAGTRFNYTFIEDTTDVDRIRMEFEEIIDSDKNANTATEETELNLDYELSISISNIAELEIILAQAVNQKLSLEVAGSLNYENIDGRSRAQGSFELLDGSKLEFFKTFEADGNIRFESEITDPYLNIVATYTSDYTPPNSTETREVAVKLKLEGPVSGLGQNLANKPENISVYVGARNIENNIPDERYDASDALSFILVNRFKSDLTAENRQEVASQTIGVNTATSLLGSVLTGFVNQAVGDVVNNIQLSQSGEYTKFAVSGRFSNFKYSFGGTTELFQNINKANLKVDYYFSPSFLIRVERKDPVVRTFGIDDKITELGLKYRFEF